MGRAWCEVNKDLLDLLHTKPFCDLIQIHRVTDFGEGYFLIHFSSENLGENQPMLQSIVLTPEGFRFSSNTDT
jgi:hypothetical protein